MTYDEIMQKWSEQTEVSFTDFMHIAKAIAQVYPMIVVANLSKNTYSMIRDEGFLCNEINNSGCYDDLIDNNAENIHSNYQDLFMNVFPENN